MTNNQLTDVKYFTKKPVTISAIQWTGDNLPDVIAFTGKHPRWGEWFEDMDEYISHVKNDGNRFKIFTLEGVMAALPGDWIIRGVQGEHYPCKPDIFAETYAPAELQERRKADSEAVAWTDDEELRDANESGSGYLFGVGRDANKFADPRRQIMLYRHAQPAPDRDNVRREHAEWSRATFGDVGPVGPLKHLSKEALEAAAEPDDLSEWADMQFLLWDAQRRAGISDEQIYQAMIEKLAINKARQWPEPKDGEPRLHIKQPAPVMPEIDRQAIADKVYGKCCRIPGATFYNAAEFAIDEVEACRAAMLNGGKS